MAEENKTEIQTETCNCICKTKGFRNFIVVATGSFVGVFCALSLFAALHKPPMPMHYPTHGPYMRPPMTQPYHLNRHNIGPRSDFYKKMEHKKLNKKPPVKMDKDTQK